MSEFEQFWALFPRRIGKIAAQKEFTKARKVASLEDILSGVTRYIAMKPEYADWCHPRTWLSQGRWMDESDRRSGTDCRQVDCPHIPRCGHPGNWQCQQVTALAIEKARKG